MSVAGVIWLMFVWQPEPHFMMPVAWYPTEAACERARVVRRRHDSAFSTCGSVSRGARP